MEVFGTRLDVVMANLLGEKLAHMLAEPAKIDGVPFGMFVQATVNDWLRTGHRESMKILSCSFPGKITETYE